jgi:hypothetical protein
MRKKAIAKKVTAKWEYLGETDPAQFVHSNKTHRTVSEAFRDADYATAFWRSKSDWEETVDFVEKAFLGFVWVGVVAGLVGVVAYWFIWG